MDIASPRKVILCFREIHGDCFGVTLTGGEIILHDEGVFGLWIGEKRLPRLAMRERAAGGGERQVRRERAGPPANGRHLLLLRPHSLADGVGVDPVGERVPREVAAVTCVEPLPLKWQLQLF